MNEVKSRSVKDALSLSKKPLTDNATPIRKRRWLGMEEKIIKSTKTKQTDMNCVIVAKLDAIQ